MKLLKPVFALMIFFAFAFSQDKEVIDGIIKTLTAPKNIAIDKNMKNPFVHQKEPVQTSSKPIEREHSPDVAGIINKKAIIDGKLYEAGDTINGYTIQTITEKGVTFMKNGMLYAEKFANGKNKILIKRDR